MLAGAGEDRHFTVAIDAHIEFGANEIETACPHVAAEQTQCRNANLRLRRPCNHRAVGVPNDDVANPYRGAAVLGALDLSATDLDMVVAAEILFNRRRKPGRERVDLNRTAVEPPPKPEKGNNDERRDCRAANADAPDQALMASEHAPVGGDVAAVTPPIATAGSDEAAAATRVNGRFPLRER